MLFMNHKNYFVCFILFLTRSHILFVSIPVSVSALNLSLYSVFHSSENGINYSHPQVQTVSDFKLSFVFNPACSFLAALSVFSVCAGERE